MREPLESREMKCCWEGREDKRVKERQKKGQKWFLKRKYEETKNTERALKIIQF